MTRYTVRFRAYGYLNIEAEAESPDAAALQAMTWRAQKVTVENAKPDLEMLDLVVKDAAGEELLRWPSRSIGPVWPEEDDEEEEVEGDSDDDDAERRR